MKFTGLCTVCGFPVRQNFFDGGKRSMTCLRCGDYTLTDRAETFLLNGLPLTAKQRLNISSHLAGNAGSTVLMADLEKLKDLSTPSLPVRAKNLLKYLARQHPQIGDRFDLARREEIDRWVRDPLLFLKLPPEDAQVRALRSFAGALATSWSATMTELKYLLSDFLERQEQFVSITNVKESNRWSSAVLLPKAWQFLEGSQGEENAAFVAMWFADEVKEARQSAIYPAIEKAGYDPIRIDNKEHNNKIDDEIIASIRSARFVVADFTGHRGGVYYEAGFAHGLGKPVIWTVRDDQLNDVHFDTRQFNHITWSPDDLAAFQKKLTLRIEATIGRGPKARRVES